MTLVCTSNWNISSNDRRFCYVRQNFLQYRTATERHILYVIWMDMVEEHRKLCVGISTNKLPFHCNHSHWTYLWPFVCSSTEFSYTHDDNDDHGYMWPVHICVCDVCVCVSGLGVTVLITLCSAIEGDWPWHIAYTTIWRIRFVKNAMTGAWALPFLVGSCAQQHETHIFIRFTHELIKYVNISRFRLAHTRLQSQI